MSQCIPLGKMGVPEDIAYTMLFLATDEASYLTGQTIVVDGGSTRTTSAPQSANNRTATGPARAKVKSSTRNPDKGLAATR